MLHKYELAVAKEEADKVDTLRYTWEKLLSRSTEIQNELVALQPNFRGELVSNVESFLEDCQHFYQDYDKVKGKRDKKCKMQMHVCTDKSSDSPQPQSLYNANFPSRIKDLIYIKCGLTQLIQFIRLQYTIPIWIIK